MDKTQMRVQFESPVTLHMYSHAHTYMYWSRGEAIGCSRAVEDLRVCTRLKVVPVALPLQCRAVGGLGWLSRAEGVWWSENREVPGEYPPNYNA